LNSAHPTDPESEQAAGLKGREDEEAVIPSEASGRVEGSIRLALLAQDKPMGSLIEALVRKPPTDPSTSSLRSSGRDDKSKVLGRVERNGGEEEGVIPNSPGPARADKTIDNKVEFCIVEAYQQRDRWWAKAHPTSDRKIEGFRWVGFSPTSESIKEFLIEYQ